MLGRSVEEDEEGKEGGRGLGKRGEGGLRLARG